ncbi:aminotransferase class I/II-fold pyridoxal phosphate-dependent enzyme [Streptomyces aureocirculatus]|uniref:aminotransferase class I/II-fold pyridoxal phosphate-dependent enzyme n=1 Tax=Streptomyces aureocirculatus TaxID=67275 RepID=UPI00068BF650|nr:aminotransferase class I/II-fold pyridoxal phosphate-dependent enzyme [Streptomyces aureocirculatus]
MTDQMRCASRDARQGGDLNAYAALQIRLDLSVCSNRLGPPDSAVHALAHFATHRSHELGPPPYGAERIYLAAYADHLGVDETELHCGRGVTEFLILLARHLHGEDVALLTPEYTETMRRFSFATFYSPTEQRYNSPAHRLERLHQAMARHRYVILSNPNNPLGLYTDAADLLDACRQHPGTVLIVDEEYIEFQGPDLSLAGADADNLVILQSTGKTYGITGTRAGIMWTRNAALHRAIQLQLPAWPLSLLDITVATAALGDQDWARSVLPRVRRDAQKLEQILTDRFGSAVVPSGIHYRFVHLHDPQAAAESLEAHGIAVRAFDGAVRGRVAGIRVMTPASTDEFELLHHATLRLPGQPHRPKPSGAGIPYHGKSVLEPAPAGH